MAEKNPAYRTLHRYLHDQMLLTDREPEPVSLRGHMRLNVLDATGIPVTVYTAGEAFQDFLADDDMTGVRRIHEKSSGPLLIDTTTCLFREELLKAQKAKKGGEPVDDPLTSLHQTSERLITKEQTDPEEHSQISHRLIGVGETEKLLNHNATRHYGLQSATLRQLAMEGLLDMQTEEMLEEWVMQQAPRFTNTHEKGRVRSSRKEWHTLLEERQQTQKTEKYAGNSFEIIRQLVRKLISEGDPDIALEYLQRLRPDQRVRIKGGVDGIVDLLMLQHRQVDAITLLDGLRSDLTESVTDPKKRAGYLGQIVRPQVLVAHTAGLSQTFMTIHEEGHQQACEDLGLSEADFADVFALGHYHGETTAVDDLDSPTVVALLNGEYRNTPFTGKGNRLSEETELYGTFLCERILALGESGVIFPTPDEYKKNRDIAEILAKRFGLAGNTELFQHWLSTLYHTADGSEIDIHRVLRAAEPSRRRYP